MERVDAVRPLVVDIDMFPMIELVKARVQRLLVRRIRSRLPLSSKRVEKSRLGVLLGTSRYGRTWSERGGLNVDTHFCTHDRITHSGLQQGSKGCFHQARLWALQRYSLEAY